MTELKGFYFVYGLGFEVESEFASYDEMVEAMRTHKDSSFKFGFYDGFAEEGDMPLYTGVVTWGEE